MILVLLLSSCGDADSDAIICSVSCINPLQLQMFASFCSQMLPWQLQGFKSHLLIQSPPFLLDPIFFPSETIKLSIHNPLRAHISASSRSPSLSVNIYRVSHRLSQVIVSYSQSSARCRHARTHSHTQAV